MGDYMSDEDTSQENNKQPTIQIKNTRFIYKTNFSGDPTRERYARKENSKRHANLVIPDAALAQDLIMEGVNVKTIYEKKEDGSSSGVPTFYVDIKANYNYSPEPSIYLVKGNNKKTLFDESTVGRLDHVSVENVEANLVIVKNKKNPDQKALYVRQLYVTQVDDDPFADKYADYQTDFAAPDKAEEPGKSKARRQDEESKDEKSGEQEDCENE